MGQLWKKGPNQTVDVAITRPADGGRIEAVCIRRRDTGEWAFPGGFVEKSEPVLDAADRELMEETGIVLEDRESRLKEVWAGKVEDPRNTEERWIETTLFHIHLGKKESRNIQPKAGSDAAGAAWVELNERTTALFYADHPRLAELILAHLKKKPEN